MTSNDITSSGDGVLCHALFGFPTEAILIKTETEKYMSGGQCIQEMSFVGKLIIILENTISGDGQK